MALDTYKQKRSVRKTSEPFGGAPKGNKLQFVIQKHAASHLHYDFRLELKGVLKSWAVPKGPSMDPDIKHLAVLVEDHPYDYKDFEGIIPKGQYGGGTVIVWDRGTYEPLEPAKSKAEQEKILTKAFYAGSIKIRLHGKKLKGEFALVRTEGRGDNAWLLIKHRDKYASTEDITLKDKSVISRKTIEALAKDKTANQWQSNRSVEWNVEHGAVKKSTSGKATKTSPKPTSRQDLTSLIRQGKKQPMPGPIAPMLCTLTKTPVDDPDYLYEIKWDGYRILSRVQRKKVRMDSRSALDYTKRYPLVVKALLELGHDAILDGEVVVFNEEGLPDFDALQLYNGHDTDISYCVFDVLWLDGYNLMYLPLETRKAILQELITDKPIFRFSESFSDGPGLYAQTQKLNLEGIIAKKRDSPYVPDQRGNAWLKTPTRKRQEFVIGGWAESEKARSFRSLLFGAYNNGRLEWIGRSGGGYKQSEMPGILEQLKTLEIDKSPFVNKVLDTKGAKIHWVKPKLVANFEFATWTKSGRIRKPATFLGFRKDKKAAEVVREVPKPVAQVEEELHEQDVPKVPTQQSPTQLVKGGASANIKRPSKRRAKAMAGSNWPKVEAQPRDRADTLDIGNCRVDVFNVDRLIWKDISKARLLEYYHSVAPHVLPYLKDRPQSLYVKLQNANSPGLYIKDMEGRQPDCADVFTDIRRHQKAGKREKIDYLVCNNEATLLWMINLGCIDINPWNSKSTTPDYPDYIVIDLDPTVKDAKDRYLDKLLDTALATKEYCDKQKLKAFAKTSGKTGMHFYIPCTGIPFAEARTIGEHICRAIVEMVPGQATVANSINSRGNKIYVDPSQNDYADTLAAPYSVRPWHIPGVSTPLEWKEINHKLNPSNFTIDTILPRIKKKGDLFKGVLDGKTVRANGKKLIDLVTT
jgi:bifunctional non-homologous end joining protein LigD